MITTHSIDKLREAYNTYKAQNPKKRIYDIAKALNCSEVELLSLAIGEKVTRLQADFQAILLEVHKLGEVMALTRNEYAVHERKGVYNNVSFMSGHVKMGLVVNEDIDLRLFMNTWAYCYAVEMDRKNSKLYSLQFFDKNGAAIHKIYLTPKSDETAYHTLVNQFIHENQMVGESVEIAVESTPNFSKDEDVNIDAFHDEWLSMKDTHHFFGMLKKHNISRTQALRLAPKGYAYRVSNNAIVNILEMASEREVPVMIFVGNKGCIQIHTGPVKRLLAMNNWYNVLDAKFNLHLNLDGLAESWVVRKNSDDGIITALELFDKAGNQVTYCFGKRKPGIPELEAWTELIMTLPQQ